MKILLAIFALFLSSCGCKNKAQILKQRQESMAEIEKKHGNIIPPLIEDVPDFNECSV